MPPTSLTRPAAAGALTPAERQMLVRFKARYSIEERGFTRDQAAHLTFLAWRIATGRLDPAR